ncbi:MAG: outer membrane protein assembly complex, YaeT protein, partial [Verrucomicrobiales bacterium]|nr:outer membrane protein assembly complex, YaeT protein [Verrucomicrobiales bacterium]
KALGTELLIGRVSYTLESAQLRLSDATNIPPEIRVEEGTRLISKVGTSIAYDTRNSGLLPSHGQRSEFLTELAGLGGDVQFYKLEARTAWYFPGFWEGHIFEAVGRAGSVASYGDGDRGLDRVPMFDRWFLGGLYSLRGYRYRDIGPKAGGEALGGESYWFGSAEYSIPIIERLRFAMFYDVGNVYSQSFSLNAAGRQNYIDNWGFGVRLNLPIGPLRLDYGIPINHDPGTGGSGRFQFGVGYTREF